MENIALNDIKTLNELLKILLYVWKAFEKKKKNPPETKHQNFELEFYVFR